MLLCCSSMRSAAQCWGLSGSLHLQIGTAYHIQLSVSDMDAGTSACGSKQYDSHI
jgi:hypothetical protein